ncbi:MAG: hypothetical protein ACJ798_02385 [Phenylobacterium sp.]
MMRGLTRVASAAALLALAACQPARNGGAAGGGNGLCLPFPGAAASAAPTQAGAAVAPPIAAADPAAATDDCLHRWAYALAGSTDDATHVAQAVVAACSSSLARWNQQTASAGGEAPIEAPSLITGQPTSPIAEHLSFAQNRALLHVVQARAGKCAAPPMADGVPSGLARD